MSQRILINLNGMSRTTLYYALRISQPFSETSVKRQQDEDSIAAAVTETLSRQSRLSAQSIEEISREVRSQLRSRTEYEYDGRSDKIGDALGGYGSSGSSTQPMEQSRRRTRRSRAQMTPIDSAYFLDTTIDEVDIGLSSRPTPPATIVDGRRTLGKDDFEEHTFEGGSSKAKRSRSSSIDVER